MNTASFTNRHRSITLLLSLANAILATWLLALFITAPGTQPDYGMSHQEFKLLRYSQAE